MSTEVINTTTTPIRILRRRDVEKRIGLSRSSIYLHMSQGNFPKPIKLGGSATEGKTAVGWLEHEIDEWLQQQIDSSRTAKTNAQ